MTNPISEERLRNTRAWAAARVGSLSGADVIVGAIDELISLREAFAARMAMVDTPVEPKCEHGKCITGNADCAIGTTTTCAKCGEPICAGCGRIRRRESSDEPQIVGWHDTKTGESGELCTLCGTTFRDGEANGLCGERGPWRCNKPYGHSGMHQAGPNPLQEYGWEDDEPNATLCSCGAIGDFHEEGCSALNRRAEPT